MKREFWSGRRVFLTGHSGFKGAWLALWLERIGARVTGFSLPPDGAPNLFVDAGVGDRIDSRFGDLRDLDAVVSALEESRAEVVFHLAAQALVHEGYRDPLGTYAVNVQGTAHLLEAVRRCPGVRSVVSVTSDKCYHNAEWAWGYRESDPLGGRDPYSSSKACAELVTAAYRDAFFAADGAPAVATARSGNVVGGGDWAADRLVPDLVRAFAAGEAPRIRQPDAVRPWQHVLEPLAGYLELGERLAEGGAAWAEPWNFGPDEVDARPVAWIADRVAELWGGEARWERDPAVHPPEATFLKLDTSKARSRLGWRPRLPLDAGLEWTVEWYREAATGGEARDLCERQIAAFEALPDGDPAP